MQKYGANGNGDYGDQIRHGGSGSGSGITNNAVLQDICKPRAENAKRQNGTEGGGSHCRNPWRRREANQYQLRTGKAELTSGEHQRRIAGVTEEMAYINPPEALTGRCGDCHQHTASVGMDTVPHPQDHRHTGQANEDPQYGVCRCALVMQHGKRKQHGE
ncbi:hypothetical protein B4U45_01210 [Mycobacterium persicum]|uniref:Uncharacterized protein n=1 Tax=Mycobacterium persicum TaxID=1487726 RepID=A0A8E2IM34_9MYCO|nr:hypothetical protein B4U45_01210 [Mycobacterium persicum]